MDPLEHGWNRLVLLKEIGELIDHEDELTIDPPDDVFEDTIEAIDCGRNIIEHGRTRLGETLRVCICPTLIGEKIDVIA